MEFLYAIINFLILAVGLYLVGRKTVSRIFSGRLEKINKELDEAEQPLPSFNEESANTEAPQVNTYAIDDEKKSREATLEIMKQQFEKDKANMRLEMLYDARTRLVDQTVAKAQELMESDEFKKAIAANEEIARDRIISLLKLSNGDKMYLKSNGKLEVTIDSAYPLRRKTIDKLSSCAKKLADDEGGEVELNVNEDKKVLIGGFRIRIGDTVYDYTIRDRLWQLRDALNDMPFDEKYAENMQEQMESAINNIDVEVDVFQVGRVLTVSDGICWMDGLSDIMYGELVEFVESPKKMYGMVLDVQPDKIGCIIFGRYEHIETHSKVRRLGRMADTNVGEELLGRVIDPLGNPIDGKGRIWTKEKRNIECEAPAIPDREPVNVPLETGIKAIDALVPIGRGQRELIIGDRQTGKTAIVVDTIINQKNKGVYCIYVAIGQKETTVASIVSKLETYGAMDYTTVVCASASDSASIQYIAPFVGTAIAEYYMYSGRDALIIYDDLSKHAVAYRELSLLLHRPSGREAYPGDIFYLHSRLLERSANINEAAGGGSITALPCIETQAGDISAYIPTNVISITDGQIFLETELFNEGQRPAINVGLSVSRVGGAAQSKFMKQVSSNLRTGLAQYREYATFTQFGSEVDEATRKTLASGERMMGILKQDRYKPMPTWQQALLIYAVSNGAADDFNAEDMSSFETQFLSWMMVSKKDLCDILSTGNKLTNEVKASLDEAIKEFRKTV